MKEGSDARALSKLTAVPKLRKKSSLVVAKIFGEAAWEACGTNALHISGQ